MSITSPKSRGNFNFKFKDDQYEGIFGHSGVKIDIRDMGTLPKDQCQRHDFDYTRKLDKNYGEMRRFNNPKDQSKISNEIFGRQQEYRSKVIKKELAEKYG